MIVGGGNNRALFGHGNDLQIYHDGNDSYIDGGTGNLSIRSEGLVKLGTITGSETCLSAYANGAVELYYDNSKKLETASDKILLCAKVNADATYDLGASGARWNNLYIANDIDIKDNGKLLLGDSDDLEIFNYGSHSFIIDNGQLI